MTLRHEALGDGHRKADNLFSVVLVCDRTCTIRFFKAILKF